jgi:Anthrone oxygenase
MATESFMSGELALATAAAFTGAALYINVAEHPARLEIDSKSLLAQWRGSYSRGFAMQASLALLSTLLGLLAYWLNGNPRWIFGALLIFANWPFTLVVILPINTRLHAVDAENPPPEVPGMIRTWGMLHAVRSVLGLAATAVYLWAIA